MDDRKFGGYALLGIAGALILTVVIGSSLSSNHGNSNAETPNANQDIKQVSLTPAQTVDNAANEAKQQAMAGIVVSALRHQGVSSSAHVVAGELVIDSDMAKNHDQREILASAIFSKTVQQKFCDVGVHKAIISGGVSSSQDTYDMTCKPTAEERKAQETKLENNRQDYARQLSSDLSQSNIESVSAKGLELDFVAKAGMQKAEMLKGVQLMTRSEIGSSWCGMGFRQIKLHMDSADSGTAIPLHCGK